jgi:hypothetical protein
MLFLKAKTVMKNKDRKKFDHNTYFEAMNDHAIGVYLHGNRIAVIRSDDTVSFSLCGWNTVTTRDRINAVSRLLFGGEGPKVFTAKGEAFISEPMRRPIEFFDGVTFNVKGNCTNYWNRG